MYAILKKDYVASLGIVLETSTGHWIKVVLPARQRGQLLTTHLEQAQVSDPG